MAKNEEKEVPPAVEPASPHTYTLGKIRADMLDAWQSVASQKFTLADHMVYQYFPTERVFAVKWIESQGGQKTTDLTNAISSYLEGFIAGVSYMATVDETEDDEEDVDEEEDDDDDPDQNP